MIPDAISYAKQCHACQIYGDFITQAPGHLRPTTSSWLFEMWGMDVVGPISPPSFNGHRFILSITDYFSKWAEAIPLREVKTSDVIKFIKHYVAYRFGVPRRIVHDNGPQFYWNLDFEDNNCDADSLELNQKLVLSSNCSRLLKDIDYFCIFLEFY